MSKTSAQHNPFDDELALQNSSYNGYRDNRLFRLPEGEPAAEPVIRVHDAFRALILDPEYPCVGSRSAVNQGSYRFGLYADMNTTEATAGLARDLHSFVAEQPSFAGDFSTFVACFNGPKAVTPDKFETLLWGQLKSLHELDRGHHDWDPDVSADTEDPRFSFSFGGRAYFVVGLAPPSDRWARQFPWPTMAFNAHYQFEVLRESRQFERVQEVIRDRDRELMGDTNPNLADFGEHTEARQYSGREVEPDWRCPVSFE